VNEGEEFLSFRHVGFFNLSTRNKLFFIYLGLQMFLRNKFLEEEEEEEFLKTKRLL